jgi:hypothetical protein
LDGDFLFCWTAMIQFLGFAPGNGRRYKRRPLPFSKGTWGC